MEAGRREAPRFFFKPGPLAGGARDLSGEHTRAMVAVALLPPIPLGVLDDQLAGENRQHPWLFFIPL